MEDFDCRHRIWRERLVAAAPEAIGSGERRRFTPGVAAKLINCYLKPLYVTGVTDDLSAERTLLRDAIHPPIDRILLQTLAEQNVGSSGREWRRFAGIGWSNFTHEQYEAVIEAVKRVTHGRLWTIEEHWGGYRA
ncbi:hypothetical protein CT676_41525 [Bradyrhizobium sp. MOS001]|uniref:hypothetical protein n=1 Tax=Bradyrhizobium sp. MOS001 TaxID=2133948 RepID=UPI00107587A3|nr:hypothetical protein [Bradyrhizobium sp. MOS001]TFW53487.1 hypothetical protein CT676_41525 [Bradyrhizobium sp. MOS001]